MLQPDLNLPDDLQIFITTYIDGSYVQERDNQCIRQYNRNVPLCYFGKVFSKINGCICSALTGNNERTLVHYGTDSDNNKYPDYILYINLATSHIYRNYKVKDKGTSESNENIRNYF